MKRLRPVTIDTETFAIEGRPVYPPVPVGVSIKKYGSKAVYYAFGHPTDNNCTFAIAKKALRAVWGHPDGLLFHNAKFDLDVLETHFKLRPPKWQLIHDTMFLLFLHDPHSRDISLKASAARLLRMPPEEQDAVAAWLVRNPPLPGVKISKAKASQHYFAKYIAYAPGGLVGKYADGDVARTEKLFTLLHPLVMGAGMQVSYDRERRLLLALLDMERQGVPVDTDRLRSDVAMYQEANDLVDRWIIKALGGDADLNLNSGECLVDAMVAAGKVDTDLMPRTPKTGKFQTSRDSLLLGVTDQVLLAMLKYRAHLKTCLNTFMRPWLITAEKSGGLIYTQWNQVKSAPNGSAIGTRTGRLSSTPNFQNIPKVFSPIFHHDDTSAKLPRCPLRGGLPPLPTVRGYITPFQGEVLIDRDYSQQEPRILGHYENGALLRKYQDNKWIDLHDNARDELANAGRFYARRAVKNTNLGIIYGMGAGLLAANNGMSVPDAAELKRAILTIYPGLKRMYRDMRDRAVAGEPLRTWGGRVYYCEPTAIVDGTFRQFDYKMVNLLIQGSAADCTKEALLRFYARKRRTWRLLLNIHDSLTASVPQADLHAAMGAMRRAMESIEFDVAMMTEGSASVTSLEALKDYDKKGIYVWPEPPASHRSSNLPVGPTAAMATTSSARSRRASSTLTR